MVPTSQKSVKSDFGWSSPTSVVSSPFPQWTRPVLNAASAQESSILLGLGSGISALGLELLFQISPFFQGPNCSKYLFRSNSIYIYKPAVWKCPVWTTEGWGNVTGDHAVWKMCAHRPLKLDPTDNTRLMTKPKEMEDNGSVSLPSPWAYRSNFEIKGVYTIQLYR